MDYNDVKTRLQRTFTSLNDRFDEDIIRHTNIVLWENGKGFSLTFGNTDKDVILNKILIILYNLSSLKDHLKNSLKNNGFDPTIVEKEIDSSIHLQVLIDIVNQDKHGTPLKNPRSQKEPMIDNPTNSFRLEGHNGVPTMFIDAIILDNNSRLLFRLDELVETCFLKWQVLEKQYSRN